MGVIISSSPYKNLLGYSILPIGKPVTQSFESTPVVPPPISPGPAFGSISYNGGQTANNNDYFEFDRQRIYYKTNPKPGELQAGVLTTDAIQELFWLLRSNPYLKSRYIFQYFATPGFELIGWVSTVSGNAGKPVNNLNVPTVPFFSTTSPIPVSIAFPFIFSQSIDVYTGQVPNQHVFIQLIVDENLDGLDNTIVPTLPITDIILDRSWQGLSSTGQNPIEFDYSLWMKQFLGKPSPVFGGVTPTYEKNAIAQYFFRYGEQILLSRKFNGSENFRLFVHNSYNITELHQDRLPTSGYRPILTLQNFVYRVDPIQLLSISFIYHYVPFDLSEPLNNNQTTYLKVNYMGEFEDGTVFSGSYPNVTPTLKRGQYNVPISFGFINYQVLEQNQGSKINFIEVQISEYLTGPSNERPVTTKVKYIFNNALRCYAEQTQTELIYHNSLGGYDSLLSHESLVTTTSTTTATYDYDKLNREVYSISNQTQYKFTSDQMEESDYKWLTNLLESDAIWMKQNLAGDYERVFIVNSTYEYDNQLKLYKLGLTLQKLEETNNLTK